MIMKKFPFKSATFFLTILFLVLVISSPFLHNHPVSFQEPSACPAHLFEIIISAALILLLLIVLLFQKKQGLTPRSAGLIIPQSTFYYNITNRAPPFIH
jgi:hypothetical protein